MARTKKPSPPASTSLAKVEPKTSSPTTVSFVTGGTSSSPVKRRLGAVELQYNQPLSEQDEIELVKREWEAPLQRERVFQLAFRGDPHTHAANYSGLYRLKPAGLPDTVLKRVAVQDSLVAAIVTARQSQFQQLGQPREDRFHKGFFFDWLDKRWFDRLSQDDRDKWQKRQLTAAHRLVTCGSKDGWTRSEQCSFGQFLKEIVRSALTVGRIAVEIINVDRGGETEFHSFRAVDAGTIYPTIKTNAQGGELVRERSQQLLRKLYGEPDLEVPEDDWDDYEWLQILDGNPIQVFTDDQIRTKNFYSVPDIEWGGFPVTPIDNAMSEVLTHISIVKTNLLWFQQGRQARGMIVITSDDVDQDVLMQMRQQFMASVNGTSNSGRMPVFGLAQGDDIRWVPIDNSSRDMEFQYLSDNTCRALLSSYQMSPEELPGYGHLSRGTNSQSLSESNSEYQLEAARDLGIRPLIANIEAFINDELLPLIDPELGRVCRIRLGGLEAKTQDQEDADLERLIGLDGTMNDVLVRREKQTLDRRLAADVPLNQQWAALLQSYVPVGVIMESLMGVEGASKDPRYAYVRDPFYWQQLETAQAQLQSVLQPPLAAMAPQVLPALLRIVFPYLDEKAAAASSQAVLQQLQQMQQQAAAQAQAQPAGGEVQKSEGLLPNMQYLTSKHRRIVDQNMTEFAAGLDALTKQIAKD